MRFLLKYFVWLLSLFFLFLYYLLGTTLGHLSIGHLSEDYLSETMKNEVEILELNLEAYPQIKSTIKINDRAILFVEGHFDTNHLNMNYTLQGESFKWNRNLINYPIDVYGQLKGKSSDLHIVGQGKIFQGDTSYDFVQKTSHFEDIKLICDDINATQLLTFLDYDLVSEGQMDMEVEMKYYRRYGKEGFAKVDMEEVWFPELSNEVPFALKSTIDFKDSLYTFNADLDSEVANLKLKNASFNSSIESGKGEYVLEVNELKSFAPILNHSFAGPLETQGYMTFEDDEIVAQGTTPSLGGEMGYQYQNESVELDFEEVSLEKLLHHLKFPALLSSKVIGTASYDFKTKISMVNAQLKDARFRRTNLVYKVYQATGVDISQDVYNDNAFSAGYQDNILTFFLQINNGINYLYLPDVVMNRNTNQISSNFQVKIDGELFSGKIDGSLEDPQVELDMTKIIKYHINKRIENFFN